MVVPLNTDEYKGGGTEFHNHGVLNPLPIRPCPDLSFLHKPAQRLSGDSGDRYLLVLFWLYATRSV